MTRRLLFLLGQTESDLIRWAIAAGGEVLDFGAIEGADGLASIAPFAREASETVALIPGEQVASRVLPTAPKSRTKLLAAASCLMEDELAEAMELVQVGAASGQSAVAMAARADVVRGWLAAFEGAGIDLDVLTADYLALASSNDRATIIEDRARVIAAFAGTGCALEKDLFCALAPGLFDAPSPQFLVFGDEALCASLPGDGAIDRAGHSGDAAVLGAIAQALNTARPPNLLEKRFFRKKQLVGVLGPWRRAAALGAALAAVAFLSVMAEGARFSRAEAAWERSARELHESRFAEAAAEDPAEYARRRLAAGGGEASFLIITSRLAAAIEANGAVEIDRVRFDAARGDYIISVKSKSDAAVEAFKGDLAQAGVAAADSGGFRRTGDAWSGDLKARLQ